MLKMYSQQRRFERYRLIYIWKVISGKVPNYGLKFSHNERRGLMVDIPTLKSKVRDSVKTIRGQSLTYHGGGMFNMLPSHIRSFQGETDRFKAILDDFLSNIPD